MKKIVLVLLLVFAGEAFSDLPILQTRFRKEDVETVLSYARQNNAEAQVELALRCYAGHQVPQNFREAFEWMKKAAESGNPDAQILLSRMYSEGIGTKADQLQSEAWFAHALVSDPENIELQKRYEDCRAEKKDNPEATREFITLCSEAGYVPAFVELWLPVATNLYWKNDHKEALKLFQQLAAKNDPAGTYYLAKMYSQGQGGLPEDYIEAFDLYYKAACANCKEAQYELACMYEAGRGTIKDINEAENWYKKSARDGNVAAQYKFAESEFAAAASLLEQASLGTADDAQRGQKMQKYRQKIAGAVEWYGKAAAGNHSGAQYMMGRLYASGEGVSPNFQKSIRCYEQAAEQGHVEALFYMGLMYHAGLGVEKDIPRAIAAYEKAAEQGLKSAMFYLGNCYRFGAGVEQNALKGENYYLKKVLDGVSINPEPKPENEGVDLLEDMRVIPAAREYGVILWRKASSEKDFAEAIKWVNLAARHGDRDARDVLIKMISRGRRSYGKKSGISERIEIPERCVDPRSDAMCKKRDIGFLYPYLQEEIGSIYAESRAQQPIAYVLTREGPSQDVAGDNLWELFVKYKRPSARDAVGFRGVLLMGVEFTDDETGEKYWAFNESRDIVVEFSAGAYTDVSMFMNMTRYPHARITGWGVVYGHLLDDDLILTVFDERQKSKQTGDLKMLASNNQYSQEIKSTVVSTVDILGVLGGGGSPVQDTGSDVGAPDANAPAAGGIGGGSIQ